VQAGLLVHDNIAGFDRRAEAAGSSEHGTHADEQLFECERLDQVVVGPELETLKPIVDRVAGRQEVDRQITSSTQSSRELEPIAIRDQHIEHGVGYCAAILYNGLSEYAAAFAAARGSAYNPIPRFP
jgi:hypothetical protein